MYPKNIIEGPNQYSGIKEGLENLLGYILMCGKRVKELILTKSI